MKSDHNNGTAEDQRFDPPVLVNKIKCTSVQIQSILYNNQPKHIERVLASLARSVELAKTAGLVLKAVVTLGDSSPLPCLDSETLLSLDKDFGEFFDIKYQFFGKNLGSARGHNTLAKSVETDYLLIQNPDVIVSPVLLEQMLYPFQRPGVGIVEAKQIPIEHPKDYDLMTGETSWASTACALFPTALFRRIGGFDAESFFLYCDDVDFSWQARLLGYKVIFQPAAMVFHDKRLSPEGHWQASSAEHYYSAEAALTLARKWSRPDIVERLLKEFKASPVEDHRKAVLAYEKKVKSSVLPEPIDPGNEIGQFIGIVYAKHRYTL